MDNNPAPSLHSSIRTGIGIETLTAWHASIAGCFIPSPIENERDYIILDIVFSEQIA